MMEIIFSCLPLTYYYYFSIGRWIVGIEATTTKAILCQKKRREPKHIRNFSYRMYAIILNKHSSLYAQTINTLLKEQVDGDKIIYSLLIVNGPKLTGS